MVVDQHNIVRKVHAGLDSFSTAAEATAATAAAQTEAALVAFEAQYCTPATFLPSE